jgi:hypothetical protein
MDSLALGFTSSAWQERCVRQRRQDEIDTYESLWRKKAPEAWNDLTAKFQKVMFVDAKTWNPTLLFDCEPLTGAVDERMTKVQQNKCLVRCPGAPKYAYSNHLLPKTYPLTIVQGNKRGIVYFTDDVIHPVLYEFEYVGRRPRVWMGLTPMEILTQRKGIRMARGRVVVGGLGLGWFLNHVCLRKHVTEVIVVDREKALLDWLAPVLKAKYPALIKVLQWVHEDIYVFMEKDQANHDTTRYLLDIWASYGGCDVKFDAWKRKLGPARIWGWGDIAY